MPDPTLNRLIVKNLCYTVKAAVASDIFKHIYVSDSSGEELDALQDGKLACAYVVSGILTLHGLIDHPHATVVTTLKAMETAGWKLTTQPRPGDVVHWPLGKEGHQHLGFYLQENQFMSNSAEQRQPILHGPSLQDGRLPDGYYTHDLLHNT